MREVLAFIVLECPEPHTDHESKRSQDLHEEKNSGKRSRIGDTQLEGKNEQHREDHACNGQRFIDERRVGKRDEP